jgi:FkbM family methyltransferase
MQEINKSFEIVQTSNGNFLINENDVIGNFIKNYGFWENHLQLIYSKLIKPNFICIDAGANLGYHSIQFGKLSKIVYSFEPQPMIYNQLCANILFNSLDNTIKPIIKGLGDKASVKQMWAISKENFGNNFYNWGGRGIEHEYATHNSEETREEDLIEITTIDDLNLKQLDFIKIDIQGYEYYAFIGAEKTLNKFKPIIFLENSLIKDNKEEIMNNKAKNYLLDLGYELYRMYVGNNDDCILVHPDNPEYKESVDVINYFSKSLNIIKE